jgi:hypothetical protein
MLVAFTIITALVLTITISAIASFSIIQPAFAEIVKNRQQQIEGEDKVMASTRDNKNNDDNNNEALSFSTTVKEGDNVDNVDNGDDSDNADVMSSTNDGEGDQECRTGNVLENVYDPGRLNVLSSCEEAIGIVDSSNKAHDDDIKLFLNVEDGYQNLLNKENDKKVDGLLVVEIIPSDQDSSMIEIPKDGDRVRVIGAWVTDEGAGGWNEIHPAWKVEVLN